MGDSERLLCRCHPDSTRCSAVIYHGPGHQSHTHCEIQTPHEVHEATYGRYDQQARWKGEKVFSGFFDEPPTPPEEEILEGSRGTRTPSPRLPLFSIRLSPATKTRWREGARKEGRTLAGYIKHAVETHTLAQTNPHRQEKPAMPDRLADEMERRIEALDFQNSLPLPPDIQQAVEAIRRYCVERGNYQSLRHSNIFVLSSEMALVEWD